MAEWWLCEEGGYICSKCGCYYDDYYIGLTPTKCSKCNSEMIVNNDMEVDRNYRLTKGINFVDESEYPEWLLKLRGLTMAEMSHCYGCGAYIPELLIDDNNKVNFRCTRCGCETRPQNTLDEAEKLWNEGRTYPHSEKKFWGVIERKINNG